MLPLNNGHPLPAGPSSTSITVLVDPCAYPVVSSLARLGNMQDDVLQERFQVYGDAASALELPRVGSVFSADGTVEPHLILSVGQTERERAATWLSQTRLPDLSGIGHIDHVFPAGVGQCGGGCPRR